MINDEELMKRIDEVTESYVGQLDYLYESIGMVVSGRLLGWRVMRLVSSGRCWTLSTKLFGDPKLIMPERGKYYYKSLGMKIIDSTIQKSGEYWDYINRVKPMAIEQRKMLN
jgi:hypothetical protein